MRRLEAIPPAAGAVVMGTGIVSIGLSSDHRQTLSKILLGIAAATWIVIAAAFARRAVRDRDRLRSDVRSPSALTGVAGTAVLGSRLVVLGWSGVAIALLVIAVALGAALAMPVARNWSRPTIGVSLMTTVATESLAVLLAELAIHDHAAWLSYPTVALLLLGVALYAFVIAAFDFNQLLVGRGDHWITGGALAISALASAHITLAARALRTMTAIHGALESFTIALWWLAIAWIPILLVTETVRPRLNYDLRRWAVVFPVGMYAASSFVVGSAAHAPAIAEFAKIWIWVSLALWSVVSVATVAHLGRRS